MSEVAMQTIDQLILVAVAGVKPVLSTAAQQRLLAFAQSNPQFGPVIVKYAPAFWSMADSEITGWIDRLAGGDTDGAYRQMLSKLSNADLLKEWDTKNAALATANQDSARKTAMVQEALAGVLGILLKMALAAVAL